MAASPSLSKIHKTAPSWPAVNRAWRLRRYPVGLPTRDDFEMFEAPAPGPDDVAGDAHAQRVVLRSAYLSPDPYMRTRMKPGPGYLMDGFEAGANAAPIDGYIIAQVTHCGPAVTGLKSGDYVKAFLPWQQYHVCDASRVSHIDIQAGPPSAHLGVLGLTGLTAYFSSLRIGKPSRGETAFVSAAAGATGSVAGQIFKSKGCRVVGSAGTDEKLRWLKTIGFDAAINYKVPEERLDALLADACPDGIDIYFDNVGGPMLDAVLKRMNKHGRIICCGMISQYSADGEVYGLKNLFHIVGKQLTMQGFLLSQWKSEHAEGTVALSEMVKSGALKHSETIVDGFENAPDAVVALLKGANTGKTVVKIEMSL